MGSGTNSWLVRNTKILFSNCCFVRRKVCSRARRPRALTAPLTNKLLLPIFRRSRRRSTRSTRSAIRSTKTTRDRRITRCCRGGSCSPSPSAFSCQNLRVFCGSSSCICRGTLIIAQSVGNTPPIAKERWRELSLQVFNVLSPFCN